MNSLQTKLFRAFTIVISLFAVAGIALLVLNRYVVQDYKSISDNMIAEYRLTQASSGLIAAYNNRFFLNSEANKPITDKEIADTKSQIKSLTEYLNGSIVDEQAKIDYIGLKNSINDVTAEVDAGLTTLDSAQASNYTAHYTAANKKYAFVTQNSATLLFDELRHSADVQAGINRTYLRSTIAAIVVLVLIVIGTVFYAFGFARRLIVPLKKLTNVAGSISGGDWDATIDPNLIKRHDEVGTLSQSFNVMLMKLRGYIQELNKEKASVEHKVTQRTAELSEQKARLAASVDSLSLGFVMTDAQNKILMINDKARAILSYQVNTDGVSEVDPVYAKHEWSVDEIDDRLKEHFAFKQALTDEMASKRSLERKEVEYNGRILRLFLTPILRRDESSDSEDLGSVVLLEDITEEKVIERSKDEFFSIASHELRTPLTAIRGNASMLEQFYGEQIKDEDFHNMLKDIHESTMRLIGIVNDFLDASRLEQGKIGFKYETFNLDTIIEAIIYETGAVAKEKKNVIKLNKTLDSTPPVYADKDRVKQIIYNLIGNAMKFTENGTIAIAAKVEGKLLKVSVTDSGPGISEQNQKLLFHKFQQAGDSLITRDTSKGTGLGLYISKLLVEKMGGHIALENSHAGKGSTFSFTLPLQDGAKPEEAPGEVTAEPAS